MYLICGLNYKFECHFITYYLEKTNPKMSGCSLFESIDKIKCTQLLFATEYNIQLYTLSLSSVVFARCEGVIMTIQRIVKQKFELLTTFNFIS